MPPVHPKYIDVTRTTVYSAGEGIIISATAELDVATGGILDIGAHTKIMEYVYILVSQAGARVTIGGQVGISRSSIIGCKQCITIGDGTLIGPFVQIIDHDHGIALGTPIGQQGDTAATVTIGSDVWVGAGAKVLKGVTIHDGAVIGANAVVTHDIPANAIAVGIPAKVLKYRE